MGEQYTSTVCTRCGKSNFVSRCRNCDPSIEETIAIARTEALNEAKEAIKNDLKTYRDNGRRDPKGHVRAMMLIDKILVKKDIKINKTYTVTMTIVDDNLGLENSVCPERVLRYHMRDGNISFDDFEIISVEEED